MSSSLQLGIDNCWSIIFKQFFPCMKKRCNNHSRDKLEITGVDDDVPAVEFTFHGCTGWDMVMDWQTDGRKDQCLQFTENGLWSRTDAGLIEGHQRRRCPSISAPFFVGMILWHSLGGGHPACSFSSDASSQSGVLSHFRVALIHLPLTHIYCPASHVVLPGTHRIYNY